MPILAFTLSMPNRGSWNGRWSGEDKLYVEVRSFAKTKAMAAKVARIVETSPYYYRWSDGWGASIEAREVTAAEARGLRAKSAGFAGYEWMVDSILSHGAVYADNDEIPAEPKAAT